MKTTKLYGDKPINWSKRSCMSREAHVQFCEQLRGRFPRLTLLVILTKTRGQLRKIMKKLYIELDKLQLKLSKPKTFIGKIERGFSFLGYAFGGCEATPHVGVSNIAICRMQDKLNELYEQHASSTRVHTYLANWWRWVTGGLNRFKDELLKSLNNLKSLNQMRYILWLCLKE